MPRKKSSPVKNLPAANEPQDVASVGHTPLEDLLEDTLKRDPNALNKLKEGK